MATNWLSNKLRYEALNSYLNGATLKVLLLESGYTPDKDDVYASELTNELTCTGYSRKTVTGLSISQDDTNDNGKLTFDAVVWAALGPATSGPATAYAVIIKWVSADADSPILAVLDVVHQTNGGQLTLTPSATGAIRLS